MEKTQKNISIQTIYQNAKKIDEDWFKKIKIYKIEKFDNVFLIDEDPIDKENSIWGGKFKIECLRTQLEFSSFNWFYWGFNCKKIWFLKSN